MAMRSSADPLRSPVSRWGLLSTTVPDMVLPFVLSASCARCSRTLAVVGARVGLGAGAAATGAAAGAGAVAAGGGSLGMPALLLSNE